MLTSKQKIRLELILKSLKAANPRYSDDAVALIIKVFAQNFADPISENDLRHFLLESELPLETSQIEFE